MVQKLGPLHAQEMCHFRMRSFACEVRFEGSRGNEHAADDSKVLNLNTEIEIKMAEVRDRPAILISIPSNLNTNSGVHAKERIRKWHIS